MSACHEPTERIILPRAKPGWCGVGLAEINLADLGTHWIWSIGFQMHTGDMWGSGGPLWDGDGHRAPTRDDAIAAASDALRAKLGGRVAEYPDARAVIGWLDTLRPDQPDLFGVAA